MRSYVLPGVNEKLQLHQVQQIIGALPNLAPEQKTKATELMQQLLGELSKLPAEDAEAIRVSANELLEKASAAKPNRTLLSLSAKGLQEAAAAVQGIAPAVVTTVRELLGILKLLMDSDMSDLAQEEAIFAALSE